MQGPNETVNQYALDIKCLIKRVYYLNNWAESDKIYNFTKGLHCEISYQLRPYLTFRNNVTLEQTIEAARQMKENNNAYPEALLGFYSSNINSAPIVINYNQFVYNHTTPNDNNNLTQKALAPKQTPKQKKQEEKQATLGKEEPKNTPMICKGQVAEWTIDIIIDSGIHRNKKSSEGIINDIPVHLGDIVIAVNMKVINTNIYTLVLENDWLRKAKAVIDYNQSKIKISDKNKVIKNSKTDIKVLKENAVQGGLEELETNKNKVHIQKFLANTHKLLQRILIN
ncbi:5355_t:CDS:2 [Cetraspora pellucida]|uniref:5355_t:CDS:1 n=1 Tax=Cetraspora pellucida TaxID=1433469 RepID=A0A9N9GYW4_9GLOM|nr:5355_t:CDS:2 [Cetraspora pellucida]